MSDQAIYNTHPEVVTIIDGKTALDKDGKEIKIDKVKVDAEEVKLKSKYDAKKKEHDDAKVDTDDSIEGLARRVLRLEKMMGVKDDT